MCISLCTYLSQGMLLQNGGRGTKACLGGFLIAILKIILSTYYIMQVYGNYCIVISELLYFEGRQVLQLVPTLKSEYRIINIVGTSYNITKTTIYSLVNLKIEKQKLVFLKFTNLRQIFVIYLLYIIQYRSHKLHNYEILIFIMK